MSLGKRLFDVVRANLTELEPDSTDELLEVDFAPAAEPDLFTEQERRWYRDLRLEPGASVDEIRRAYRQQMRTFHPDRFAADPAKFELATQVARGLTEAYNGLLRIREG